MTYQISPSTLKDAMGGKFACRRCFYLKVRYDVRPPKMEGLGALLRRIHGHFFNYLKANPIDNLPDGQLVLTELEVHSQPKNGIELWGYIDGLIRLPSGAVCVLDLKTTQATDWIVRNYALQVNVYAYCLEHPKVGSPAYAVERMGIISWSDTDFAMRTPASCGIRGELMWHEVRKDYRLVERAIENAQNILSLETLPVSNSDCEWCRFYDQWGIDWDRRLNTPLFV